MNKVIPKEILEYLRYDPTTGDFFWVRKSGNSCKIGEVAGKVMKVGYRSVCFRYQSYYCHRLAFFFMGEDVPEIVDHINGDRLDNRWSNLRSATSFGNSWNSSPRAESAVKYKGVTQMKSGLYRAKACRKGVHYHLGVFKTPEEASGAYESFAKGYDKEFYKETKID